MKRRHTFDWSKISDVSHLRDKPVLIEQRSAITKKSEKIVKRGKWHGYKEPWNWWAKKDKSTYCEMIECKECNRVCPYLFYWHFSHSKKRKAFLFFPSHLISRNATCGDCEFNLKNFSKVESCKMCGVVKKYAVTGVFNRYGYDQISHETLFLDLYCVSCWNKLKAAQRNINQIYAVGKLINQIKKEISNGKQHQDNGAASGFSGEYAGGSEGRRC